jgi:hypothetical protein
MREREGMTVHEGIMNFLTFQAFYVNFKVGKDMNVSIKYLSVEENGAWAPPSFLAQTHSV